MDYDDFEVISRYTRAQAIADGLLDRYFGNGAGGRDQVSNSHNGQSLSGIYCAA